MWAAPPTLADGRPLSALRLFEGDALRLNQPSGDWTSHDAWRLPTADAFEVCDFSPAEQGATTEEIENGAELPFAEQGVYRRPRRSLSPRTIRVVAAISAEYQRRRRGVAAISAEYQRRRRGVAAISTEYRRRGVAAISAEYQRRRRGVAAIASEYPRRRRGVAAISRGRPASLPGTISRAARAAAPRRRPASTKSETPGATATRVRN